jgi:hypothetical protein
VTFCPPSISVAVVGFVGVGVLDRSPDPPVLLVQPAASAAATSTGTTARFIVHSRSDASRVHGQTRRPAE